MLIGALSECRVDLPCCRATEVGAAKTEESQAHDRVRGERGAVHDFVLCCLTVIAIALQQRCGSAATSHAQADVGTDSGGGIAQDRLDDSGGGQNNPKANRCSI